MITAHVTASAIGLDATRIAHRASFIGIRRNALV